MPKSPRHIYVLIGIGVVLCLIWIVQISLGQMPYVDQLTRGLVELVQGTFMYSFFLFVTDFGSRIFLIPFVIGMGIVFLFLYRNVWPAVIFAGGTLCSHILNMGIKEVIERERPSILAEASALGYSFPSGHAMISTVCYGLLCYFLIQKMKNKQLKRGLEIIIFLFILLIGMSRYFINVHYITDVFVGFLLGFILLQVFIYLYERVNKREKNRTAIR